VGGTRHFHAPLLSAGHTLIKEMLEALNATYYGSGLINRICRVKKNTLAITLSTSKEKV
jgi:hypothetical protein